jgi:hypothetical protein
VKVVAPKPRSGEGGRLGEPHREGCRAEAP